MKKLTIFLILTFIALAFTACRETLTCNDGEVISGDVCVKDYYDAELILLQEMEDSFYFFWDNANTNPDSRAYGLISDRYPNSTELASIASVGFGLAGIPIAVDHGWITEEEGQERALGTLESFQDLTNYNGFYYHFMQKETGWRSGTSEVSSIDTALFIAGAITVGEYFGGEVKTLADELYARIDWTWFVDDSRHQFYMAYNPGAISPYAGHWDFYAEALLLYVLGAGAPNEDYRTGLLEYNSFTRRTASYGGGEPFISSWFGSLFTYQYSHAFIDFRDTEDAQGINWFENSVNATIANRQYAIDTSNVFTTFGENSWGMTACDGPYGYSGYYGSKPSGYTDDAHQNDGTIAPAGALGSVVFLPDAVMEAALYFDTIPDIRGHYGFFDAYNFDYNDGWIDDDVIGIDKGITMLMIANYFDETVWTYFMQSQYVLDGLARLNINQI